MTHIVPALTHKKKVNPNDKKEVVFRYKWLYYPLGKLDEKIPCWKPHVVHFNHYVTYDVTGRTCWMLTPPRLRAALDNPCKTAVEVLSPRMPNKFFFAASTCVNGKIYMDVYIYIVHLSPLIVMVEIKKLYK